ncbi:MAG: hypothetical protein KGL43_09935 [Burkholderiales bacterium]|nr:hypothetical protein [Burkholderiales bacterium]MDE2453903.1 hypothetical protein [Burkholderiales bacterium]
MTRGPSAAVALLYPGVRVSAHPDALLRLGAKDVLLATRSLPFGSDVHRVGSLEQLAAELPVRLQKGTRLYHDPTCRHSSPRGNRSNRGRSSPWSPR